MAEIGNQDWQAVDALDLYSIRQWGEGYADVSDDGHLLIRPYRDQRCVDLHAVIKALPAHSVRLPALLRFVDILHDRVHRLVQAFDQAIMAVGYAAGYSAIYPIKVNQQADVVREIATRSQGMTGRVGLEAGSKPELLAVLGLAESGAPIICNGYKDREYVRLAGIGVRMGHKVTLVVEKPHELQLLLDADAGLPDIGLRIRLSSIAAGNWQNTGGAKSKFGLTSGQVLAAVAQLRAADALHRFRLLHLHLGSQIANIDDIERGIAEAARVYCDLRKLGVPLLSMDVGGGLGVDYEGTASRSFCSMNYSMQDYANTIVSVVQKVCGECGEPVPELLSESGRALTAHHAVLITDVVDIESAGSTDETDKGTEVEEVARLAALKDDQTLPFTERYQRACALMQQISERYSSGRLDLSSHALAESHYREVCRHILAALDPARRGQRELLDELQEQLAEKYFVNLSIFQSMPDVWALDQIFPVVPVSRLDEKPDRRALLCDLTCDSDGRIDRYIDAGGVESTLPVHAVKAGQPYWLAFFMVGAYQEILGDMHNLFGDTDAVNVQLTDDGWEFSEPELGDSPEDCLRMVHCEPELLIRSWREKLVAANIDAGQLEPLVTQLQQGLQGYTYLSRD